MSAAPNTIKFVSIKELSEILSMSENALKPKIPPQFVLEIGKAIRYDLYGIINYFKQGESAHHKLIDDILK